MLKTPIVFYQERGGSVPAPAWLGELPEKTFVTCRARIDLLEQLEHDPRRPIADYLLLYVFHT